MKQITTTVFFVLFAAGADQVKYKDTIQTKVIKRKEREH